MILYDKNLRDLVDRYTLIIEKNGVQYFFGMSEHPQSVMGFNQFIGTNMICGEHLGTVIALEDVSEEVQAAIQNRITNLENEVVANLENEIDKTGRKKIVANKFKKFAYND